MKWLTVDLFLLVCCSLSALPQAAVFEDIEASIPWVDGRTRIAVISGSNGAQATVRCAIAPWLEIVGASGPTNPCALEAKVLLVRDLRPLSVAAELAIDRISLLSSLFFGPVGADIGRTWGLRPARWAIAWLAPHPQLSMAVGVGEIGDRVAPVIGIRWRPGWAPRWVIALRVDSTGPTLSIGAWR